MEVTYLDKKYPLALTVDEYNCYQFVTKADDGRIFYSIKYRPIFRYGSILPARPHIEFIYETQVTVKANNGLQVHRKTQDLIRLFEMVRMHNLFVQSVFQEGKDVTDIRSDVPTD
jgi:hypothetical protein